MELELARLEHRQRQAEAEWHNSLKRTRQARQDDSLGQETGPEDLIKADWPLISLRIGPFQLALFRTVRLPAWHLSGG